MICFSRGLNPFPHMARVVLITSTALSLSLTPALAATKVGVASAVIPQASIGDTLEELKIVAVGDEIDQDVIVQTGPRGRTQVLFVDGSSMNIGPSSRLVIDSFVFDPEQLDGKIGARIEKGSMRFIGGVLSKRPGQVSFSVGESTVGIRGGIAKVAIDTQGRVQAQLVHGNLSVQTPEGIFETARVGTLIERSQSGSVATRTVTAAEEKQGIDAEAKESFIEPEVAAGEETGAGTEGSSGEATGSQDTAGEPAQASEGEPTGSAKPEGTLETGDVLVDDPLEAGLVELGADGKLKASSRLQEIDPQAAELIDSGAIGIDEEGKIMPTARMIELDDTVKDMFNEGLLTVDENGFLVPTEQFEQNNLYDDVSYEEAEQDFISEVTLSDFSYEQPLEISEEEQYKNNVIATRAVLSTDQNSAKLYDLGQLEVDEFGLLKPSESFNPLVVARTNNKNVQQVSLAPRSYINDSASDKMLLRMGSFDTKVTTRVVGVDLANNFYSENVTKVVSADIVREDALSTIDRLAKANGIGLPEDIKQRSLKDLVSLGGALSTSDALQARFGKNDVANRAQNVTIDTRDGSVLLSSQTGDGEAAELKAEDVFELFLSTQREEFGAGGLANVETGLLGFLDLKEAAPLKAALKNRFKEETLETPNDFSELYAPEDFASDLIAELEQKFDMEFSQNQENGFDTSGFDKKSLFLPSYEDGFELEDLKNAGEGAFLGSFNDEFFNEADTPDDYKYVNDPDFEVPYIDPDFLEIKIDDLRAESEQQGRDIAEEVIEASKDIIDILASLLSAANPNFKNALDAVYSANLTAVEDSKGDYVPGVTTHDISSLQAETAIYLCDCDQTSTGLWTTKAFTDGVAKSLTYQHQGHWAIGQALNADTIQSLVGISVSFKGHAYGSVTTPSSTKTGFGEVTVNMDFANPEIEASNTWQLNNFTASNIRGPVSASVPITGHAITANSSAITYAGASETTQVSGAVYGTSDSLQTAGTFKMDTQDYAIRGSYAAALDELGYEFEIAQ